ncbi:MAG: methionine synthase [Rhodospirillales bacterium]|nr:methionine synthase [Rhodospirillales bacterium]
MSDLLSALRERVLLADGGFGSQIQAGNLTLADFEGLENCTDVLVRSRPDLVRAIHAAYFAAGADLVETNSFGASPVTLAEFGLAADAFDLNKRAALLAREAMDGFAKDRPRFVVGSVGPGTKLPTLGHIAYADLEEALAVQCRGLIAGAVDAILIETCQDPLQIKAAVNGAKRARREAGAAIPIFVQVTVETTGTLLVGTDIGAAATVANALDLPLLGLNCATGPQEMAEHVGWLAANWPGLISVQPNAGLPELVDGQAQYPLGPEALAHWHERFILEDGVNLVGGCCGTTPDHIRATDAMLRRLDPKRPAPKRRSVVWVPAVASLYTQVPLRQENAFLSIGERLNANGSKKFRELQEAQDWDGVVAMAKEQAREGSHTLDVCTAFVGRDESADMRAVVERLRGAVNAPLVIDSTELGVLKAALELYGGRAILNSINFENGESEAAARLELAKTHGAAVIALTIDETGMAKDASAKLAIAKRLYDFAVGKYGLAPADLLFDPLTFTVCTGNEDDRRLAIETLEAIGQIRAAFPESQIVLGLSNISFGLKPQARQVLNSVFLDLAVKAGMTAAIVHVSKIVLLHAIPAAEAKAAEDLLLDRRAPGYDPLQAFIALFEGRQDKTAKKARPEKVEDRLKARIVDGDRQGIEADLDEALAAYPPLAIVNDILLDGMKTVGELFGSGKMQLPFVLQAAETMKAAVAYLEPKMEKSAGSTKGTIVLATVKGDVHDIGKNLVDIILTNNGYRVVNLGIKQPIGAILDAVRAHQPDAIGLSGLLVKSTVVMKENLVAMTEAGVGLPVLLGGAALTRKFVEIDCLAAHGAHRVAYARDAFDGLELMARVAAGTFDDYVAARPHVAAETAPKPKPPAPPPALPLSEAEAIAKRREDYRALAEVPKPPFWGPRLVEGIEPRALIPYLNETMLYQFHWGFKKSGRSFAEWKQAVGREARPILERLLAQCEAERILEPKAVYGYFPAVAEGQAIILLDGDGRERARFDLPRQETGDRLCLADFLRERRPGEPPDVLAIQIVTMGQRVADVARQWFEGDRYQDYLYLHGLGVEMTEALAEHLHKRIRAELGIGGEDARDIDAMLKQGYRGARYSFGYPACPNLADQRILLELLGAERIGVALSDEDQLHPEQSTSALVFHHPKAQYFRV